MLYRLSYRGVGCLTGVEPVPLDSQSNVQKPLHHRHHRPVYTTGNYCVYAERIELPTTRGNRFTVCRHQPTVPSHTWGDSATLEMSLSPPTDCREPGTRTQLSLLSNSSSLTPSKTPDGGPQPDSNRQPSGPSLARPLTLCAQKSIALASSEPAALPIELYGPSGGSDYIVTNNRCLGERIRTSDYRFFTLIARHLTPSASQTK